MFCLFPLRDRKHVNDVNRSKNILSPCGYNLKDWDRHRIQRVGEDREWERERERERKRVKQESENRNSEWKGCSREGIGKRIKSKTRISFTYEQLPFAYQ